MSGVNDLFGISSTEAEVDNALGIPSSAPLALVPPTPELTPQTEGVGDLLGLSEADAPPSTRGLNTVEVSRDTNPDKAARTRELSTQLNVAPDVIAANPDAAEEKFRRAQTLELLGGAKVTDQFLSDPSNAAIAHDSVKELSFLEGLVNTSVRSWSGIQQVGYQFLADKEAENILDASRSFNEIFNASKDENNHDISLPATLSTLFDSLYRYSTSRIFPSKIEDFVANQKAVGDLVANSALHPMSAPAQRFMTNVQEADGFFNTINAIGNSDVADFAAFGAEVGLEFLPQLLIAGAVTAATKNPQAGALTLGLASGGTERFRTPADFLQKAGVDLTDPKQVEALLSNPVLMDRAKQAGVDRGLIIGAIDTFSGGIAGVALHKNPLANLALQTLIQATAGGGGDALAQLKTTGQVNWDDVVFEAVAEFATAPIDVALLSRRPLIQRVKDARDTLAAANAMDGMDQIAKGLQDSPVTERAPDVAAEHMARLLEANGIKELHISAQVLSDIEDNQKLLEDLGVTDQMPDALQYDGDVQINAKAFSRNILQDPEIYSKVKEHIRADLAGITVAEGQELDKETEAEVDAASKNVAAGEQADLRNISLAGMDALISAEEKQDKKNLIEALGGKEGERISKLPMSKQANEVDKLEPEEGFTAAQNKLIFGIGEAKDTLSIEELQEVRQAVEDSTFIAEDSDRALRIRAAREIIKVDAKALKKVAETGKGEASAIAAFIRLRAISAEFAKRGDKVADAIAKGLAEQGMDPNDVTFIMQKFAQSLEVSRDTEAKTKVTDADGKPLVVFHGSPVRDFTEFDLSKASTSDPDLPLVGFHFSDSEERAASAGRHPYGRPNAPNAQVRSFTLNFKNPAVFSDIRAAVKALRTKEAPVTNAAITQELKDKGFDGFSDPSQTALTPEQRAIFEKTGKLKLDKDRRIEKAGEYINYFDRRVAGSGADDFVSDFSTLAEFEKDDDATFVAFDNSTINFIRGKDVEGPSQLAEHEAGVSALFATAKDAGFTETQYASYIEAIQNMRSDLRRAVERRKLKHDRKRNSQEYKDAEAAVEDTAREAVRQRPLYVALLAIGRDRLDYNAVKAIFQGDEKAMQRLPLNNGRRIYAPQGTGGIDPNIHADLYGFRGGDAMLFAFMDNLSFEDAVKTEITRAVEAQFPTIVNMRTKIQEALEELHKPDNHGAILAFELARLRQMRGQKRIQRSLLQARAKALLSKSRIGDINTSQLEALQRREAKRATKALRAGDLEAAAKHKLNQVLAFEMTRESYKVKRELEKGNKFMAKFLKKRPRKRGKVGGLPIDHLEKVQEILSLFQFGARRRNSGALQRALDQEQQVPRDPGEDLKDWVARKQETEGLIMEIGPTITEADGTTNWKNLTLAQWRDLKNSVKSIVEEGRAANRLRDRREGMGVSERANMVLDEAKKHISPRVPRQAGQAGQGEGTTEIAKWVTLTTDIMDTLARTGLDISGIVLNTDSLLLTMDGMQSLGPAYRFIKGGIDHAWYSGYLPGQVGYVPRMKAESEKLNKIFDIYSKAEKNALTTEQDIQGVHLPLSRLKQIGVLLNMGNAENIAAMTTGKKATDTTEAVPAQFTEAELELIVNNSRAKDVQFIQEIWDFFDEFRDEIRTTVRRRQNRNPVMVEAQALNTPHGTVKGGYYFLHYDNETHNLAGIREGDIDVQTAKDLMIRGGFATNHTQDGHFKTREGSGGRPVKLDPFAITQHLSQLIYDLEMGDAVHDSYKVLHSKELQQGFNALGKPQILQAIDLWLGDVITGELHRAGMVEGAFRKIRTGTTVSKLAWNVSVALQQPLGLIQTSVLVGKRNTIMGLYYLMGGMGKDPFEVGQWVDSISPMMAQRQGSYNKDIQDAEKGLADSLLARHTPGNVAEVVHISYFIFITKLQRFADLVTWLGARRQGGVLFQGDMSLANEHADRMVPRTQGSGVFHERTSFERGTVSRNVRNTELVRNFSLFLNFFAAKLNVAYVLTKSTNFKSAYETLNYAINILLLFVADGVLSQIIRQGGLDEDEENNKKELITMAMTEGASSAVSGLPVVREVASALQGFDTGGAMGSFLGATARAGEQIGQGEIDFQATKAVGNVLGILMRLPTSQVFKTGQAVWEQHKNPWDEQEMLDYLLGPNRKHKSKR